MGSRGTLFYNTAASPLPGSAAPQLRAGVNRWEALVTLDMKRAQGLDLPASDWWCAELEFDEVSVTCCDSAHATRAWASWPGFALRQSSYTPRICMCYDPASLAQLTSCSGLT